MAKLYRPRGIFTKTGRDSWISGKWYQSKKEALQTVDEFGARRNHTKIRIIESSNSGTYKGKHIKSSQIIGETIHIRM